MHGTQGNPAAPPSIADRDWITESPHGDGPRTDRLSADEKLRLAECSAEPIHLLGRVQSHGSLLVVDRGVITVVSADRTPWLGLPLAEAHPALAAAVEGLREECPTPRVAIDGHPHDVMVHKSGSHTLVEIEPAIASEEFSESGIVATIHRLSRISDPDELLRTAAREIKAATGFDRVLGYRFFDDGHGQVLADEHAPGMEPILGLHFPASDVPAQARELYVSKLSRSIADTADPGQAVRYLNETAHAIDLGQSELRMASPHHLEFMRNMGQVATFTLSLVDGDQLIGMFTCAHREPRRLPLQLRSMLEVLARLVAANLAASREISRLRRQLDYKQRRAEFVAPLYGSQHLRSVLEGARATVRDLISSDGVYLRFGEETHMVGKVPQADQVARFLEVQGTRAFVTDALTLDHPELAGHLPGVAGVVVVPLLQEGDCLVFFRGDVAREVDWLGDQSAANRDTPLSPRRSFSRWRESVTGRSIPWGADAEEAFALGEDIRKALTARENAQLAELALHDALTGLPNRRYLAEHTDRFFESHRDHVAAVFLDIDDFKAINDTYGHDVGDAVLVTLGRRLRETSREQDIAVRMSGDEFVVLCHGVDQRTAHTIASRLVQHLARPMEVAGTSLSITVSAGVEMAAQHERFEDLLRAADGAMYRAKRGAKSLEPRAPFAQISLASRDSSRS